MVVAIKFAPTWWDLFSVAAMEDMHWVVMEELALV